VQREFPELRKLIKEKCSSHLVAKIDAQAYLAITSYAAQKPLAPNTPPQGASLTRTQTQPSTLAVTLTRALIRRLLGACRGAGAVNEAAGKDWRLHAAVEFLEEKTPAEYLCCAVDCIAQGLTQSRHHVVLHCAVPGGTNADEPLVFSKFFCSCGESVRHGWVCRHFIAVHRRIPQAAFQLGLIHDTFFTDPQPSRPSYQVVASPSFTAAAAAAAVRGVRTGGRTQRVAAAGARQPGRRAADDGGQAVQRSTSKQQGVVPPSFQWCASCYACAAPPAAREARN
jgi:hypothetical protein